jgi:hypothetical protein
MPMLVGVSSSMLGKLDWGRLITKTMLDTAQPDAQGVVLIKKQEVHDETADGTATHGNCSTRMFDL